MAMHNGPADTARATGLGSTDAMRYVAAALAALTAILYVLIGLEVIWIGTSTSGEDPGLLGFGLMTGGAFAAAALLLLLVRRRWAWIAVGLLQLVVIGGYFALAEVRDPPYAPWGLVIKAVQLAILLAVTYLIVRGAEPSAAR